MTQTLFGNDKTMKITIEGDFTGMSAANEAGKKAQDSVNDIAKEVFTEDRYQILTPAELRNMGDVRLKDIFNANQDGVAIESWNMPNHIQSRPNLGQGLEPDLIVLDTETKILNIFEVKSEKVKGNAHERMGKYKFFQKSFEKANVKTHYIITGECVSLATDAALKKRQKIQGMLSNESKILYTGIKKHMVDFFNSTK